MNLFLGKSSEKHLKCEKYDKRKARAFAWDFVYSLRHPGQNSPGCLLWGSQWICRLKFVAVLITKLI